MVKKKKTGLELAWEDVAGAKFRCGLGSILGAENISSEKWNDWQIRLLEVENEMRDEMKKRGLLE